MNIDYDPLDDRYRWCVYCGADCWPEVPKHQADCPYSTSLFPVEADLVGERCGRDNCDHAFKAGESYMLAEVGVDVGLVTCIGCATQESLLTQEDR